MFRLLGFPVHVRSGFVVFMLLIVVLYGNEFGLWLAGSIAVFTLLHELGHALAARATGAEAEISLDFLAGYAAYTPTRPLSRLEQAGISFAGPAAHIAISSAVLLAMGVNPLASDSYEETAASLAIWWAGPVIGAINLVPILPLDGGNILLAAVDKFVPGRSRRIVLWFSIGLTIALTLFLVLRGWRIFAIFVAFLIVTQVQMLNAGKPTASPWQQASAALDAGRVAKARRVLLGALSHPQPSNRVTRIDLPRERIVELIDLLPEPLPHGDPANEYVLANLLLALGRHTDAANYAAGSFERHPNTLSAALVARASAAAGDQRTAIGWLQAAADAGTAPGALASTIDAAPELLALRDDPEVVALRRTIPG